MATALLEKPKLETLAAIDTGAGIAPYLWTVDAYYRAFHAGGLKTRNAWN